MMIDLREIGPTYYFAPPRVFETQLTNVMIRMEDAGRVKKWLFDTFMAHARRVGPDLLDGKPVGLWDRLKYLVGDLVIYSPLKNTLGLSRVRVGYTAGEAIGPEIFDFYRSLGINLKQLYGQTEATVFITVQPDGEVRSDTVGVPAPGVELKIADNGEVYYRSPGVFEEYYKNAESTADTKDPEGWVATGDAGFIEPESGHLRIIDRAKDVGKLSDGSLFAPKYVENKLKFYPNILEAVVFGNEREKCMAFIKDFLLSRIVEVGGQGPVTSDPGADDAWQTEAVLEIGPHPDLSDNQRRAIEMDYGMEGGHAQIAVRRALLFYALKRLGLDTDPAARRPQDQQIILLNRAEVVE
jgi:long-chain acyl-CoA synthetase